jgi:hypothetical protein
MIVLGIEGSANKIGVGEKHRECRKRWALVDVTVPRVSEPGVVRDASDPDQIILSNPRETHITPPGQVHRHRHSWSPSACIAFPVPIDAGFHATGDGRSPP